MAFPINEQYMMYGRQMMQPNYHNLNGAGSGPQMAPLGQHVAAAGHYGYQPPAHALHATNKENGAAAGWAGWPGTSGIGAGLSLLGDRKRARDEVESQEFKRRRLTGDSPSLVGAQPQRVNWMELGSQHQQQQQQLAPASFQQLQRPPTAAELTTSVQEMRSAVAASCDYDLMYASAMHDMYNSLSDVHGC